jgi:hypothetical protein
MKTETRVTHSGRGFAAGGLLAALFVCLAPAWAGEPGAAERFGKSVDKAADSTGKAVKKAGEKVGQGVETAGKAVTKAAKKTGDAVGHAVEKTGEAIENVGGKVKSSSDKK